MKIRHDVPQRSVLGSLWFLLYINDLPLNIYGENVVKFAIDINVLITDIDVGAFQNEVDRVIIESDSWFQKNDLIINAGKIVVMSFHCTQTKMSSETSSYF